MDDTLIFNFKADISSLSIPVELNNPFGTFIPELARVAAAEFKDFIGLESEKWAHDFHVQKGKMFGVLVVQKADASYGYLGTFSGKFPETLIDSKFIPSVFDDSIEDSFIHKGMKALSELSNQINYSECKTEISTLKVIRKQKSIALQQKLFENYQFLNLSGEVKGVLEIFEQSSCAKPPVAAGECAAPKLLQYAIEHQLKPIAIAEFWWGKSMKHDEREHASFYPACEHRCRLILEYMLEDTGLFERANTL